MKPRITPTIMDGVVVRWGDRNTNGEVSASRNGVLVCGRAMLRTPRDLEEINVIIAHAWECYRFLAKRAERFSSAGGDEVREWLRGRGLDFEEPSFL